MLYKKNHSPELDPKLFQNPTCEYRGAPFWAWNCQLNPEQLKCQIGYLREMGFGGFHMHSRTGMATPYLSKEFQSLIRTCVTEAKEQKMLAWLYDEDRWPSGAAGGLVTKTKKYRARMLEFSVHDSKDTLDPEQALLQGAPYFVAAFDIFLRPDGTLDHYTRIGRNAAAHGTKWYVFCCTQEESPWYNNQTYVDTLNPQAIQQFIRLTYENYLESVGAEFDNTIPAIFTDEPQFNRKQTLSFAQSTQSVTLPWTFDFPKTYQKTYHSDLLDTLPELLWDLPNSQVSLTRYRYHDHVAERFASAFADQCGNWCGRHNLLLTGHMMEEPTLHSQTSALGDAMRSYRSFQLPGIDMLCNHIELTTAKQAQSACHQYGREGVLSELYGVTDWSFDFRGHKFQGDWQAALGVTVRVPHLSWVSMEGESKRDYPASINYQSPWYQEYPYVENHFARLNTVLTRGKPIVPIGVIHPVESYWLHFGPAENTARKREELDEQFQNFTKWMLLGLRDFDFIAESLLPSQLTSIDQQGFGVGKMNYSVVIVPGCETLRRTTLEALKRFHQAGGTIIFMGDCPKYVDALPSDDINQLYEQAISIPFSKSALLDALEPYGMINVYVAEQKNNEKQSLEIFLEHQEDSDLDDDFSLRDDAYSPGARYEKLICQFRQDTSCRWLFLAHAVEEPKLDTPRYSDLKLVIRGAYTPRLYDTITGTVKEIAYQIENGTTVIQKTVYSWDSLLIRLDPPTESFKALVQNPQKIVEQFRIWDLAEAVRHEPNPLVIDTAEFSIDGKAFLPREEILRLDYICRKQLHMNTDGKGAQPWVIPDKPPEHFVTLKATISSEFELDHPILALERAETANIQWNGYFVKPNVTGWYVDESIKTIALPPLLKGENQLMVTLPIGERISIEWMYLLGDFDVRLEGTKKTVIPPRGKLGFDCVTRQGLPFYGGNITYRVPITTTADGRLRIYTHHYRGSLVKVAVDGKPIGVIAYAPYRIESHPVKAGEHMIEITLFGNRANTFRGFHNADFHHWVDPNYWRSEKAAWTDSYRLSPFGLLSAPLIQVVQP